MESPRRLVICGERILLPQGLTQASLVIENGIIAAIHTDNEPRPTDAVCLRPGTILSPGLIDAQVNGGGGVLFNASPDAETIRAIGAAHRNLGVTSFLPTLITDSPARMQEAAQAFSAVADVPSVLGLHLEGPFLSPEKAGIHDRSFIRRMEAYDRDFLTSLATAYPKHRILLTLAPECTEDTDLARLAKAGVLLAAGHCTASPARLETAFAHGLRGFTHLFNAMPPIESRKPGPVAAALMHEDSWCGIIADAIHVDPLLLRLVMRCKKPGQVFLVSDAMPPAGTDQSTFELNRQRIHRIDGRLTNDAGTLAGADLSLPQAVRTLCSIGVDLAEALRMASTYPADFLNLPHLGRIALGCRADFTLLSDALEVEGTWLNGDWQAAR